ncbi:MAG: hypothetical protein WCF67_00730 [Chitinophagaceae bacterium]
MKNKAGLFVLLAEVIAIVVLHTARVTSSDPQKSNTPSQSESVNYPAEQKPTAVAYTHLK